MHQNRVPDPWNGIGYNIVIHLDGTIWWGRGLEFVGSHTLNYNSTTIGIGFQGRYDDRTIEMPDVQFNVGVWVCKFISSIYGNIPIVGHRDLRPTACPGQFFPLAEMQTLQYRGNIKEEDEMTQELFNKMMDAYNTERRGRAESQWSREEGFWRMARKIGIFNTETPQDTLTREQFAAAIGRLGLLEMEVA